MHCASHGSSFSAVVVVFVGLVFIIVIDIFPKGVCGCGMPDMEAALHLLVQRDQDGALVGKPRRHPTTALPMASPSTSSLRLNLQVFLLYLPLFLSFFFPRLAAPISSLNLVQGSLDLFQVLLQEALPNLKERKYLRGWIQV